MVSRNNGSLLVTISGLVFGLAGIMCGMVGDNWFRSESRDVFFGLSRMCFTSTNGRYCEDRKLFSFSTKYIWGFDFKEKILDDIFTMLMMSSVFALLGLVISITMSFCCYKNKYHWKFLAFLDFLCITASASLAMAGAGISESFILHQIQPINFTQDWTSSITWIGAGILAISTISSLVMFCMAPENEAPKRSYVENYARATLDDVHFNFILNKPLSRSAVGDSSSSTQYQTQREQHRARDYSTDMSYAVNMLPLQVTSLNAAMYRRMDDNIMLPPRYSPTPSEYSLPPSYNEAMDQQSSS